MKLTAHHREHLNALVNGISIVYRNEYLKEGKALNVGLLNNADKASMVSGLTTELYYHCYCRRNFSAVLNVDANVIRKYTSPLTGSLVEKLRSANYFNKPWDKNWILERKFSNGSIMVRKLDQLRLVFPGQYVFETKHVDKNELSKKVEIRQYPDYFESRSPVFFFIFGEYYNDNGYPHLLRFYWNLKQEGATILTHKLTKELNKFKAPFQFKCLANAESFDRTDAAVLYVEKRYYVLVREILKDFHGEISTFLKTETPMFCFTLLDGIGVAEQPGDGKSFGMSRCAILAKIIVNCIDSHVSVEEWTNKVEEGFLSEGLSLDAPYLNKGSKFNFDL